MEIRILPIPFFNSLKIIFNDGKISYLEAMDFESWQNFVENTKNGRIKISQKEITQENQNFCKLRDYILETDKKYRNSFHFI